MPLTASARTHRRPAERRSDHERRSRLLGWLLAAGIASTALHYAHNFVEIDRYPSGSLSNDAIQAGIVVLWPLLTAVGLLGHRFYARGRFGAAHSCLAVYSVTGLSSLGHFLVGTPDVEPFWFATIVTDGLTGSAILAFVVWSASGAVPEDRSGAPA